MKLVQWAHAVQQSDFCRAECRHTHRVAQNRLLDPYVKLLCCSSGIRSVHWHFTLEATGHLALQLYLQLYRTDLFVVMLLCVFECICSEGGFFKAHLTFSKDYPVKPPKMKFVTEIWHPNSKLNCFKCLEFCYNFSLSFW